MASAENGPITASFLDRLRDLVPPEKNLWCAPKAFVESGNPADVILAQTEEMEVDLIVLGTKTRPTILPDRPLPMATAYKIASQALCPVLTVHARVKRVAGRGGRK